MTRLEIAVKLIAASVGSKYPIDDHLNGALDIADRLIQLDSLRTHAANKEADAARKEFHNRIDVAKGTKSPADIVAELAYGPRPEPIPQGGFTPYRKKPNFLERFFTTGDTK